MKISVIIPVYNSYANIERCLRSVTAQSHCCEIECLIIDDCGIDQSIELAESFIASYKGEVAFRVFHHHANMGVSAARNTGIKNATGDYLLFLDSDDYLLENSLSVLCSSVFDFDYDVVFADYEDDDGCCHSFGLQCGEYTNGSYLMDYYGSCKNFTVWNKLYRTSLLGQYHILFDESLHIWEDVRWSYDIASILNTFYVCEHIPLYHYSQNGESLTHRINKKERVLECIKSLSSIRDRLMVADQITNGQALFFRRCFREVLGMIYTLAISSQKEMYYELIGSNKLALQKISPMLSLKCRLKDSYFQLPLVLSFLFWHLLSYIHN